MNYTVVHEHWLKGFCLFVLVFIIFLNLKKQLRKKLVSCNLEREIHLSKKLSQKDVHSCMSYYSHFFPSFIKIYYLLNIM